jgi:NodT family efflux transporter outer membrane factor (OMF) lipoprotein
VVGPDYHLPEEAAIHRDDLQGELAVDGKPVVSAPVPADWWRLYRDPRLDQLVQQAMASNTDCAWRRPACCALVRSRRGRGGRWLERRREMGAERLQESGQAFLLPEKVPVANIGDIGISASYQFDLFGTLQRGIEAAKANADATQAAADTARITLVADVVRAYTQVCAANEEREIAQHSLDLQSQSTTLIQRLRDAGRGDETQVTRSQTQFKSLRADMPRYEAARQAGLFRLSMLLAKPVDQLPAGTATCAELPKIAQLVPVGDGAALLKRRPDVRQAERRLAAATAGIGIATGELYPDISIGATIGTVGILSDLGDPSTNRWGFGPSLTWKVPTNGARAASVKPKPRPRARWHISTAWCSTPSAKPRPPWPSTARCCNAAMPWRMPSNRRNWRPTRRTASSRPAASRSWRTCKRPAPYTDVTAQLATANTQVAMSQIDLFLALGGGWESGRTQASTPANPEAVAML